MLVITGLATWTYFDSGQLPQPLQVGIISGIVALATLIIAIITRQVTPLPKINSAALWLYLLALAAIAVLIHETGGLSSWFVALWVLASVFASVFGIAGILASLVSAIGYLVVLYTSQELAQTSLIGGVFVATLPVIIGVILWARSVHDESVSTADRSYHELAFQLSQVAGKSEVVINAIADGVLALDSKGTIELINPAAQRIIGWGRQDALTLNYKSVLKLVTSENREVDQMSDPIAKAIANNQREATDTLSLVTNSGKNILISLDVSPVGQPGSGVIVVFRDVTKAKAEEREQAEFISTASHEMRTPVASIEGYLGLVLNPATATIDEKARDFVTKAHESAQHLGRLFQDLLDVTKADDGRLPNDPKAVDVVPFLHTIAQGLKPKADEKQLRFVYKPIPDTDQDTKDKLAGRSLSPVYYANVDNDHLREVVSNLIENAIKYTPSGEVIVDVTSEADKIIISVADTGVGIPKEDQSHLFQKFYRVDNSDTREIGGTGLGLYLCRRLAETMNGRIWVESEYKQGSTFYLEIPRIEHEEATRLIEQASLEAEQQAAEPPAIINLTETAPSTTSQEPAPVEPAAAPPSEPLPPPAPAPQPIAPPQIPQPATPPQPLPSAPAAPSSQIQPLQHRPNTSLADIEANPRQYLQPRDGTVSIPPRQQ